MSELVTIGIRMLEILFFAGSVGSAMVIVLASIEDAYSMLRQDTSEDVDGQARAS